MINLGGIDFELSTLKGNCDFNYVDEYIERKMISGKIRRIYKGKRLTMTLTYGFLTDAQISNVYSLIASQRNNGYVSAAITTPDSSFEGNVTINIDDDQKRFAYSNGKWIWTNWVLTLQAIDLV